MKLESGVEAMSVRKYLSNRYGYALIKYKEEDESSEIYCHFNLVRNGMVFCRIVGSLPSES